MRCSPSYLFRLLCLLHLLSRYPILLPNVQIRRRNLATLFGDHILTTYYFLHERAHSPLFPSWTLRILPDPTYLRDIFLSSFGIDLLYCVLHR